MGTQEDIEQLARAFIAEAFSALEREHIIPTPVYHPYVSVGRDYYGETLRGVEGYRPLEEALERAYPNRFSEPLKRRHSEFAAHYIFALLETCVARCGLEDSFQIDDAPITESIQELIATLDSDTYKVVCIRHVSNLSTPGLEGLRIHLLQHNVHESWVHRSILREGLDRRSQGKQRAEDTAAEQARACRSRQRAPSIRR